MVDGVKLTSLHGGAFELLMLNLELGDPTLGSQSQWPLKTGAEKSAGFVLRSPPGRLAL